jgi:hypothetical protein
MVALLENDNADPVQVVNQTRTLLQGSLLGSWTNAINRRDLDEPGRFDFYAATARAAFESAIDTARGFSPPGAVLDPDDKIGPPQILRFTPEEHQQVLDHGPSAIQRTLHFEGDDASYDLNFTFQHPGPKGWSKDWFPLPGNAVFDRERQQVAAVSRAPGNLDLFVIGFDNKIWSTFWNATA